MLTARQYSHTQSLLTMITSSPHSFIQSFIFFIYFFDLPYPAQPELKIMLLVRAAAGNMHSDKDRRRFEHMHMYEFTHMHNLRQEIVEIS